MRSTAMSAIKSESVGWTILLNNQLNTSNGNITLKSVAERTLKNMRDSGEFDDVELSLALVKVTTEFASDDDTRKHDELMAQLEEFKRLSGQ